MRLLDREREMRRHALFRVCPDGTCTGKRTGRSFSCVVGFTYSIWNWAIARRGAAYVSVYSYAVPVLAGVISFLIFGDGLSGGQIAGAGVVLAGMLLARWGAIRVARRRQRAERANATEAESVEAAESVQPTV